ncbi:hypothetical protein O9H85_22645 [Paenibacillus filicis]|uniref:Uncharacterized protein n=1 Tax=Paenibacillus gyeongsangnamensis TaxID=3388067 RepID=A0ABT4QEE4_9BACL|nr:hypothetical protein [Paenibacillus filicis]MCZ8515167.1 hypothetical protein [Paenibacillus filicis]
MMWTGSSAGKRIRRLAWRFTWVREGSVDIAVPILLINQIYGIFAPSFWIVSGSSIGGSKDSKRSDVS